jgi:hypothetical protein
LPQDGFIPGLALTIVVYGINVFGDAMRDLLDPRLRGRRELLHKGRKGMEEVPYKKPFSGEEEGNDGRVLLPSSGKGPINFLKPKGGRK